MKGIWLIVLGCLLQIPATLNGSIAAAIVLGIGVGTIITLLIIMKGIGHDQRRTD